MNKKQKWLTGLAILPFNLLFILGVDEAGKDGALFMLVVCGVNYAALFALFGKTRAET